MNFTRLAAASVGTVCLMVLFAPVEAEEQPNEPAPGGPFGLAMITTSNGEPAFSDLFMTNQQCATCHERQFNEMQGSLHSNSHDDPLYRGFAELARREAGDKVYTYCSSCHAPAGVVSKLIPGDSHELPSYIRAGVTCDVCHQISELHGAAGPWKEPGNASFVIKQGLAKFGSTGQVAENRLHTGEKKAFFASAEYCASCHTVIHPGNGFRIEHTYDEWKRSIYAERGIQCQDCHMNTVDDAVKVAETLEPVRREGQMAKNGPMREIHPHYFVGGNADADRLADGPMHAQMAQKRLRSAARIELQVPERVSANAEFELQVAVHNVAAGHNIPTGVNELRQIWVDLRIDDAEGRTLFRSGQLDDQGDFAPGTIWFGAVAHDVQGESTHKPWEMTGFLWKRTIAPKSAERDKLVVQLPGEVKGSLTVHARLLYRSAPPHVVAEVLKERAYTPTITEMATAEASISTF